MAHGWRIYCRHRGIPSVHALASSIQRAHAVVWTLSVRVLTLRLAPIHHPHRNMGLSTRSRRSTALAPLSPSTTDSIAVTPAGAHKESSGLYTPATTADMSDGEDDELVMKGGRSASERSASRLKLEVDVPSLAELRERKRKCMGFRSHIQANVLINFISG